MSILITCVGPVYNWYNFSTLTNCVKLTQQSKQKKAPKGGLRPSKTILWFSVFECWLRALAFRKTRLQLRQMLKPLVVRFGGGGGSNRLLFGSVGVDIFLLRLFNEIYLQTKVTTIFDTKTWFVCLIWLLVVVKAATT